MMNELKMMNETERNSLLFKLRNSGLRASGVYNELLADRIEKCREDLKKEHVFSETKKIAFALNNNDREHAYLKHFRENVKEMLSGMQLILSLTEAEGIVIFLPENEEEVFEEVRKVMDEEGASEEGAVSLEKGIVPVRKFAGHGIFNPESVYRMLRVLKDGSVKDVSLFIKEDSEEAFEEISVPFGKTLKDAGISCPEDLKALQIGSRLYTKEEAEKLVILQDTPVGNGVIRFFTDRHCMLQAAGDDLHTSREVSCGKCTFCREGLKQLEDFLKDTIAGRGKASQLDLMKEIAEAMDFSSMCSVGDRGADLLLDSMEKFPDEYQAHLKKVCAANICFTNEKMYIDPAKCTGCGLCIGACDVDAIEGRPGYIHLIDRTRCTVCGKCVDICPEKAVMKTTGTLPELPPRPVKISGSRGDTAVSAPAETKRRRIRRPKSEPLTVTEEVLNTAKEAYENFDIQKYLQEVGDMKTYDTDICVIAGGPAGLAAAVQAAEEGAKVILLEKSQAVGGAANMGMGPLGIGTKYQKQQMVDITVEKAFNMFMDYTHYQVDARLIKRYFSQSGETIEWLENMGVEFEGAYRYFPQSECTWHIVKSGQQIGPRAASFMNKALYNKAMELGVEFLLETRGEHIIKENDEVTGVLAVTSSGENIRVNCKAAVIATGGAGANPEMIYKETGYTFGKDMFNFAIPGITGDGLRMAWEAGVDHVPVRVEQAAAMVGVDGLPDSVSNIFFQPNLLVNAFGKRFMNETFMQNTTYLSNAVSNQKDRTSYVIVDDSIVREYIRNGVDVVSMVRSNPDVSDFYDGIKMAEENQSTYPVVGNTIEELAEKLGVDPETLKETVDQYNNYCDTSDEEFFKEGRYMKPIYKAPFYACKIGPGGYGTVGGIRINENCEACDKDFYPVPGLYAAGADACNIYNDSYMFLLPGNSMGFAVNTGRIAGKEAAAYVKELAE